MRDYLVFQLYGPLVSWGDIAVGETRPSSLTPAKSAILGLIAAALGIKRPGTASTPAEANAWENEHLALAEGYGLCMHLQTLGVPLSDYHTTQVPSSGSGRNLRTYPTRRDELTWPTRSELNTILSRREYRQDSFAVCAIWARDKAPYTLAVIREKLLEPHFTLYLGRKGCPPALPMQPLLTRADTIEQALGHHQLDKVLTALWGEKAASQINSKFSREGSCLVWDTDGETHISPESTLVHTRRDTPASRRRWQFTVRSENLAAWPAGEKL